MVLENAINKLYGDNLSIIYAPKLHRLLIYPKVYRLKKLNFFVRMAAVGITIFMLEHDVIVLKIFRSKIVCATN